jgi:hypothetical protein
LFPHCTPSFIPFLLHSIPTFHTIFLSPTFLSSFY